MTASENRTDKSANRVTTDRSDIFLGFVSFVGINTKPVIKALEDSYRQFGYEPVRIKISKAFDKLSKIFSINFSSGEGKDRTEKYIRCGDALRDKHGNDFLAQYAIYQIVKHRAERRDRKEPAAPTVYIIDQLKTKDEIELLKSIYGRAFFQISVYSARDRRVDYIAKLKAKAENKRDSLPFRDEAEKLVNQDYNENIAHGQNVGKIFQLADFIVNTDNVEEHPIEEQIVRFTQLLFGSNKYSPNHLEHGMYLAHSAALRSLDLSRQVGAAICRPTGEIAALGCNEVPKALGGTYWCDEINHHDAREYKKGEDNNDRRKQELLNEVLSIIGTVKNTLTAEQQKALKNSQFMDALEYGRIIHAEMNAITDAARLGISLQEATLYCTTLPCHMCSKHIIAAGIKRVIFLEPYPKSLTADMHPDSVKIEGTSREGYENYPFVEFSHFYGVTAQRYSEIFQRGKRKDEEGFQEYKSGDQNKSRPIFAPYKTDDEMEDKAAEKYTKTINKE